MRRSLRIWRIETAGTALLHLLAALAFAAAHLTVLGLITHSTFSPDAAPVPDLMPHLAGNLLRSLLEFLGVAGVYHTLSHIAELKLAEEALRRSQEQLSHARKMEKAGGTLASCRSPSRPANYSSQSATRWPTSP